MYLCGVYFFAKFHLSGANFTSRRYVTGSAQTAENLKKARRNSFKKGQFSELNY